MTPARKVRLLTILSMVTGIAVVVGLVLYALSQNINLFYTPDQIVKDEVPTGQVFRLGGMVVEGSIKRQSKDLKVSFQLTDTLSVVTVEYDGILPDLFREGQGIVTTGQLNEDKRFIASEILAKHDESYMPPEVNEALAQAELKKRLAKTTQRTQ